MNTRLAFPTPSATSWLHRRSPVPKLVWLAACVLFAFATYHPVPLAVLSVAATLAAISAGVGMALGRILLVFAPLAASIFVVQALAPVACARGCTPLVAWGELTLYGEGVSRGLSLVLRILAMETAAFTVLLTTHPSDLFAGLERLRLPRSAAFAASMTLHLVPILERELAIVLAAQRARGLAARGPVALTRAVVPVVVASVERAQQLAISLESRGFGAPGRRSSFRGVRFDRSDAVLSVAGGVAGLAGIVMGIARWGPETSTLVALPAPVAIGLVVLSTLVFVAVLGRAVVLLVRV